MKPLDRLLQLAPPPPEPLETGSPKLWDLIQKQLGTPLPKDYKETIDRYGTGNFNRYIIPFNPFAKNESVNLGQVLDVYHQANRNTRQMGDAAWSAFHPFDLFPAAQGLLPWGATNHFGDAFLWQVNGPPETWDTIAYNLRNGEYEVWKMSFSKFLVKLLTKEIQSVVLPGGPFSNTGSSQFYPEGM